MSTRLTLGLALVTLFALAGCGSAGSSATSRPASPTSAPSARPSLTGPQPSLGKTQTGWGIIWDALPRGFPTPPGSTPAEETATGPASANLVVEGSDAKAIATSMQQTLGAAGYKTTRVSKGRWRMVPTCST